MANPKNKGMTVREAAEEFCTQWAWGMAVSGDPGDAESQLTKMLGHKVDPPDSRRARWRARANTPQPTGDEIRAFAGKLLREGEKKGVLDRNVQRDRETAVFMAIKNIPSDPDQFDRPAPRRLWATGRRVPVDPSKRREPIPTDMWEFLDLDIEGDRAAGEGLEYCDLRIYDTEPQAEIAQTPAGRTQDDAVLANAPDVKGIDAGDSVEPPGHVSTQKSWTQDRTDYWVNRAAEIRRKSPRLSLLQIAQKIEDEDAPDDQKEAWKKKGWTSGNIHRRLKGRL